MQTHVTKKGEDFYINGKKTYSELKDCDEKYHGLLMNARFIQGLFNEKLNPARFNRFGRIFDPDKNTEDLIQNLPQWYHHGLRAITIGMQGGGACNTVNNFTREMNPYAYDGSSIEKETLQRLSKIIEAADTLGMVIIVSYFYGSMSRFLVDDNAVIEATKTTSNYLRDKGYTNVIIEVANEHNIDDFAIHPILKEEKGIVTLMDIARRESGGMLVGCSGTGGYFSPIIVQNSDVILIHGNNLTKTEFYTLIKKCKEAQPDTPLVCNEDSAASSRLEVAFDQHVSWGYYNNMTKQEPPTDWSITKGEDEVFATRLATFLGIKNSLQTKEYYLMGLTKSETVHHQRWIRLAVLHPEHVYRVDFYANGILLGSSYDEPYMLNPRNTWKQDSLDTLHALDEIKAVVIKQDGTEVTVISTIE